MNNQGSLNELRTTAGVLITGSSGLVGRYLVNSLSSKRSAIVALYHHKLPEPMPNVYPVCSDLSSSELLLAPLRGVDTIVHLAWDGTFVRSGKSGRSDQDLRNSQNIKATANLIQAAEKSGVRRFIFLSAIGATRNSQNYFLREKYFAELNVLNARIPERLIVRSSIVFGEGGPTDKFAQALKHLMRAPMFYPIPEHRSQLSPIHVRDLSEMLSRLVAIEIGDKANIIEVVGKERLKVEEVFKAAAKRLTAGKKLPIKGALAKQFCRLLERENTKNGRNPAVREILSVNSIPDELLQINNPLVSKLPQPSHRLSEAFSGTSK